MLEVKVKKILFFLVLILFFVWVLVPKFVEKAKEVQIAEFDNNTSFDIALPQGSHYFFSLQMQRDTVFSGELKIWHDSKIIYTTQINNQNPKITSLSLISKEDALNIFQKNKKYKFIFNFDKTPSSNVKLILNYLSHW